MHTCTSGGRGRDREREREAESHWARESNTRAQFKDLGTMNWAKGRHLIEPPRCSNLLFSSFPWISIPSFYHCYFALTPRLTFDSHGQSEESFLFTVIFMSSHIRLFSLCCAIHSLLKIYSTFTKYLLCTMQLLCQEHNQGTYSENFYQVTRNLQLKRSTKH